MRNRIIKILLIIVFLIAVISAGVGRWWYLQQQPRGDFKYVTEFRSSGTPDPVQLQAGLLLLDYNSITLYGWQGSQKWRHVWSDSSRRNIMARVLGDASQDGRIAAVAYDNGSSLQIRSWHDGIEVINRGVPISFSPSQRIFVYNTGDILLTDETGKMMKLWCITNRGITATGSIRSSFPLRKNDNYYVYLCNDDSTFLCGWQHADRNKRDEYEVATLTIKGDRIISHMKQIPTSVGNSMFQVVDLYKDATDVFGKDKNWFPTDHRLMTVKWADHCSYVLIDAMSPQAHRSRLQKFVNPGTPLELRLYKRPGSLYGRIIFSTYPDKSMAVNDGSISFPKSIRMGWEYYYYFEPYLSPDARNIIVMGNNEKKGIHYFVFRR